jgi:hypothetical protein
MIDSVIAFNPLPIVVLDAFAGLVVDVGTSSLVSPSSSGITVSSIFSLCHVPAMSYVLAMSHVVGECHVSGHWLTLADIV